MEQTQQRTHRKQNLILTGAVIAFAALAVAVCFLLRPKTGVPDHFVITYGDGKKLSVPMWETRTIVIRDGEIVDCATGEGEENVIRIENGEAWMETANCPHGNCLMQGRLNTKTIQSRPNGTWIICAPHRVTVEFAEGGQ